MEFNGEIETPPHWLLNAIDPKDHPGKPPGATRGHSLPSRHSDPGDFLQQYCDWWEKAVEIRPNSRTDIPQTHHMVY